MAKDYTIVSVHWIRDDKREAEHAGTVDRLVNEVFRYTLEAGNSRDGRINRHPKTAAGLVSALNKCATACHRYNDYYYLKK